MKDIDFDELDKAVNSLMSPVTSDAAESIASSDKHETPPVVIESSATKSSSIAPIEPSSSVTEPTTKPAELIKKTGRFMDVVHPSSDMRTASTPKLPERKKVSISPPSRPAASKPTEPIADKPVDAPKENPAKTTPARNFSFPDPLDLVSKMQGKRSDDEPKQAPVVDKEPSSLKPEIDDTTPVSAVEPAEPLQSLFLPDVKVEKRPLGVPTADDMSAEKTDTPASNTLELEDTNDAPEKVDTLVAPDPLLAELGEDVLAIESDTSSSVEVKEDKAVESEAAKDTDTATAAASESSAPMAAAMSSIPRQYSVKPSNNDDKHHEALYDTAAQAASPLQHPAKKKSGWLVVLWVVLLIAVGVGGALALYFLKVF